LLDRRNCERVILVLLVVERERLRRADQLRRVHAVLLARLLDRLGEAHEHLVGVLQRVELRECRARRGDKHQGECRYLRQPPYFERGHGLLRSTRPTNRIENSTGFEPDRPVSDADGLRALQQHGSPLRFTKFAEPTARTAGTRALCRAGNESCPVFERTAPSVISATAVAGFRTR